jgi:hypothetical protein
MPVTTDHGSLSDRQTQRSRDGADPALAVSRYKTGFNVQHDREASLGKGQPRALCHVVEDAYSQQPIDSDWVTSAICFEQRASAKRQSQCPIHDAAEETEPQAGLPLGMQALSFTGIQPKDWPGYAVLVVGQGDTVTA